MSEVISLRLDTANPREAQALEVLNAWIEKDFSTVVYLDHGIT